MKKKIANLVPEFRKQFIKEELPVFLYHYTSIEVFKSIIDNGEIWATVANYIASDPSELIHAIGIAYETLRERKEDIKKEEGLYECCENAIKGLDGLKEFVCIFSFSEKEDLLSQWRAYCPKGGVSIGFSGDRIKKNKGDACNQDGTCVDNYNDYILEAYIYKCIYEPEEQKKKINELFDFLLKHTEFSLGGLFSKMIQTFSYSFKHKSFKEEREWRLVYLPEKDKHKYRLKDSIPIPYWPFLTVDHNNKSIISKIMIGSSRDKENLRKYISSYLRDSSISASIKVTDTPYQPRYNLTVGN